MKLTTAQHYYVQTSYTNLHTTQTVNTDSTDRNSHVSTETMASIVMVVMKSTVTQQPLLNMSSNKLYPKLVKNIQNTGNISHMLLSKVQ
jgi:hypothetical protein